MQTLLGQKYHKIQIISHLFVLQSYLGNLHQEVEEKEKSAGPAGKNTASCPRTQNLSKSLGLLLHVEKYSQVSPKSKQKGKC